MKLLRIDSSARGASVTRKLTAAFTDAWKAQHPDGIVIERDVCLFPLPLITDEWMATYGDPATLTAAQRQYLSVSDSLVAELSAADTIIIGAPMYNRTVSAPLKAWLDQIVRVGKTFAYGPTGPKGMLGGKKTVVVTARGGSYTLDFAAPNFDLEEAYLRRILGFIGLTDVSFIHADYQPSPTRSRLLKPERRRSISKEKHNGNTTAHPTKRSDRRGQSPVRRHIDATSTGAELAGNTRTFANSPRFLSRLYELIQRPVA